jgi:hypothetical protein
LQPSVIQIREYQKLEINAKYRWISKEQYPVAGQFLQNLIKAMIAAILASRENGRLFPTLRKPAIAFNSCN